MVSTPMPGSREEDTANYTQALLTMYAHSQGEETLPDIDINWLEPERLRVKVIQSNEVPAAWHAAEVSAQHAAVLSHNITHLLLVAHHTLIVACSKFVR